MNQPDSAYTVSIINGPEALQDAVQIDCVIVGGGACGLVAALQLAERETELVVLERDAQCSGSTALSSGFIPACATQVQQQAGISDSIDLFSRDIQTKAKNKAAPDLVLAYTRASGPAINWLTSHHGVTFELLDGFLYPGHSVRRMHAVPEKTGQALVDALARAAERADVDILFRARVFELLVHDDHTGRRVAGVRYRQPNGEVQTIGCRCLILACNGYGGNQALVRHWLPDMTDAVFAGHSGNDGAAVQWAAGLNAQVADMGGYQGHGSWAVPQGVLISWALMTRGAVQINRNGQRFHDESGGYSEAAVAVLRQPGGEAINVYDQPLHDFAQQFPDYQQAMQAGAVRHADSIDALADIIGCPATAVRQTLDAISAAAASARPDSLGRRFERALEPPFFATRVTGALFHTQGGIDIDGQCRVLGTDNRPLPNLFAAGGAARGVSANTVDGYLSGNGLLSAIAGGYIAGQSAVAMLRT